MTSTRDLLEAQASSRRRLLAVLVGGAPEGREPEPRHPGRALLGGFALAALVAAVAVVAHVLT